MEKPASLRAALSAAVPELKKNPDKLAMYIIDGQVRAKKHTLGHELRYRLNINIADFAGNINHLNLAVISWLQEHQPDILGPGDAPDDAYVFEADIISNDSADVAIVLRLCEGIIAKLDDAGKVPHQLPTGATA